MAAPDKCISEQQARQLHDNWVNTREPVITQMRNGVQDTREVMWSLAELEEYLDYVKSESKKAGYNDPGIRVYFGAHNDVGNDRATVFFAPTKTSQEGADNNYDIEAFNFGTGGWPPRQY